MGDFLLDIFFDGGNEKGIATWAVVAKTPYKTVAKLTGLVDSSLPQTNNVAEYTALYMALIYAYANREYYDKINVMGDSELVVKQINREYVCNHPNLVDLFHLCTRILSKCDNVDVVWIPRESNQEADELGRSIRNVS